MSTVEEMFNEFYALDALSVKGTRQMIADIQYLQNITKIFMQNEQSPVFLSQMILVLQTKLGDSQTLNSIKFQSAKHRKLATKIAALRNLNVKFDINT